VTDAAASTQATKGQWWVRVNGHAYGPYTRKQLQDFVTEGRIRPATQVSQSQDGGWVEARRVLGLLPLAAPANDVHADAANVFVHAELFSNSWTAFTTALKSLGAMCELGPGLWMVRTRFSVGVIRNTLSQTLERGDRFVVIDATRDRLAWFNLGPEVDVRIGRVWNAPLEAQEA
jgi:hypothetical protein